MAQSVPRITGASLRALAKASKTAPVRAILARVARKELGVETLAHLEPEMRSTMPLNYKPLRARDSHDRPSEELPLPRNRANRATSTDLTEAYAARRITPSEVTTRAIAAAHRFGKESPSMNPMLTIDQERALAAAQASDRRWAEGKGLGPLDGVPVTIKEQIDLRGVPTRAGTSYLSDTPKNDDATLVSRLRANGAVILGHTVMTEFGMSPIGYNMHRTMPRNPHHPGCTAGGSSTGAAVSVATGMVPLAVGADGGGSIRTPSSLCGIFGIKPTFGRISRAGDVFAGSMNHDGPLGLSSIELATFLDLVGGEDVKDELTLAQTPCNARAALGRGVRGLRIGIDEVEWADAEEPVARACRTALDALVKEGAVLVPIRSELIRHAPSIGYQTIAIEGFAELLAARTHHFDLFGPDLQIICGTSAGLDSDSYVDAQRLRASLRKEVANVLRNVDVLALPTLVRTAPRVSDSDMQHGFLDPAVLAGLCRYAFLANVTGLPAATAPIGTDSDGLPIGLQIIGDAWDEACVLQVLAHLERIGAASAPSPRTYISLLSS
ncbi:MAG: amidase [Sandaracinaceae bacterium]|nr:amidase [Sandaracinaceae bacterium]